MRNRINKPRVFLSHARKDADFIERIENDLRKCKVETWRDQNEIRDGQPWMMAIFEDGIPTCDAILAYFTENSLNSSMVAKEVDSAILRRLSDSKIAFLPYVRDEAARSKLRIDIQTLQCRVWNGENYYEIFPSVVAEIWRSYFERNMENAVATERSRRLELELELQRLQQENTSVFSSREHAELEYIYGKLDRSLEFSGTMYEITVDTQGRKNIPGKIVRKYAVRIPLPNLLFSFAKEKDRYDRGMLDRHIYDNGEMKIKTAELRENELQNFSFHTPDLKMELFAYELLERQAELNSRVQGRHVYYFSPKMYRLAFWSDYNHLTGEGFSVEILPAEN